MAVKFEQFDQSASAIFRVLLANFPAASQIGYADIFPEQQADMAKREAHIGVIALLKHENLIAHELGSASSFILTSEGLALVGYDIKSRLKGTVLGLLE